VRGVEATARVVRKEREEWRDERPE